MIPTSESMGIVDTSRVFIQPVWRDIHGISVDMLRLDLVHPVVSGNKWFKLTGHLSEAHRQGADTIVTFGGAYSNHLIATACAAFHANMKSIGFVRGLTPGSPRTQTLLDCASYGMHLVGLSRADYRRKEDIAHIRMFSQIGPDAYFVPEGGGGALGQSGAGRIVDYIPPEYTHIAVAVGSGTTLMGLLQRLPAGVAILAFLPMKNGRYLEQQIAPLVPPQHAIEWFDTWHFGGFGKCQPALVQFMNAMFRQHQLPLDFVYTAKMMFGLNELVQQKVFPPGSRMLAIHTGGLQGNVSIAAQLCY